MAKYIKCDCCGKPIYFGETVYNREGYCAVYCSGDCYANDHADIRELDEDMADDCRCVIYDDERIKELKMLINEAQLRIAEMQIELDELEGR